MNEYLWKESFFFLTRYYNEELDMLSGADPHVLNQIVNFFTFKKYKPNSKIDFSKGGIFLKGFLALILALFNKYFQVKQKKLILQTLM